MRWLLAVAALATAALPPVASSQLPEVTFPDAVGRALATQPAFVQARGDVTNARWLKRAAVGAFLPSLSFNSSATRQNAASVVGSQIAGQGVQYNTGLNASLDLFAGFRRVANLRSAAATEDAADAGLVDQRFQITAATAQIFFTALASEELMRVAEGQLQRARQELQISVNKFQAGAATRSDTLTSTVDLGTAQLALLQAQANLATAQANLARQVGVDGLVRATADSALPPLPDTSGLRVAALQAPTVLHAEAMERAASASLWATRSQFWPILTASYGTSSTGTTQPWQGFDDGNRNVNRFSIGLSWTLFNGFQREQSAASSSVLLAVARAHAADARRGLGAQLTQQLAALFTAYAQIGISGGNVAAATEALRVQQERYRLGAVTLLDLLTAQVNLTQASVNQVQARYDYSIARAKVEALVGRPL